MRKFARLLSLLALCSFSVVPNLAAHQPSPSIRQHVLITGAHRPCDPGEVRESALGKQPPEAVLAQVAVRNNSEKPIAAIKLGWRVYAADDTKKAQYESCKLELSARVLAYGSTDIISVPYFDPKAMVGIGIIPLPVVNEYPTVFVDRPFIKVEDLRSLVVDGKLVPPGKYGLIIFVSEVRYGDGTTWTSPLS